MAFLFSISQGIIACKGELFPPAKNIALVLHQYGSGLARGASYMIKCDDEM
jgi:hypothetical protein